MNIISKKKHLSLADVSVAEPQQRQLFTFRQNYTVTHLLLFSLLQFHLFPSIVFPLRKELFHRLERSLLITHIVLHSFIL